MIIYNSSILTTLATQHWKALCLKIKLNRAARGLFAFFADIQVTVCCWDIILVSNLGAFALVHAVTKHLQGTIYSRYKHQRQQIRERQQPQILTGLNELTLGRQRHHVRNAWNALAMTMAKHLESWWAVSPPRAWRFPSSMNTFEQENKCT